MRKTRKEKLKAALNRQKEFERIKFSLASSQKVGVKNQQKLGDAQATVGGQTTKISPKDFEPKERLSNLLNLSYLPTQLTKIGWVTLILILIQVLLYFLIL